MTIAYPNRFTKIAKVLAAIDAIERPSAEDLIRHTQIPRRTICDVICSLREDYCVLIERVDGRKHGFYRIIDWGVFNPDEIKRIGREPL